MHRIGVIFGMEETFPPALVERINSLGGLGGADVTAEFVHIGAIRMDEPARYRVIVDRISHDIPFYRAYLKNAVLTGTTVINNPFWWSADDKFFGFSLAAKIGVRVPKTVLLPSKSYIPAIDPKRSLRNLEYPLDWEGIVKHIGFPAILKPATGGGWKSVSRVNDMTELLRDYDASGELVMTLQEYIDFDEYVRCICIGRSDILPIQYDPRRRCYVENSGSFMPRKLEETILEGAHALNVALGYDMNSVEFACKDGVPYAIDFTNPAPDMHRESILPKHFDWCVEKMTNLVLAAAKGDKAPPLHRFAWKVGGGGQAGNAGNSPLNSRVPR
jgi:glutathione synthase/RimK-type ligase-like ATP-grasp enzyme